MLQPLPSSAVCLFLCGALIATQSLAQDRSWALRQGHQTFQTGNGLPQNSVHAIVQTQDGYLWLGTEGGLARFDGLQFTIFDTQNTPALKSNNVRALLEDGQHALWIATAGGLTRLRNGQFALFTTEQGLPADDVFSLFRDSRNRLWALTSEGVAIFTGEKKFTVTPETRQESAISAIAEDSDGTLWLGTRRGLRTPRLQGTPLLHTPPQAADANIQALLLDSRGRLWIGTADGLILWSKGKTNSVNGLPNRKILTLYEDRQRNIWVGTEAGAAEILGGDLNRVAIPESLSRGLILSFREDREGSLWTGTDTAGVTVLRDEKFRAFGHAEGVPDDLIRCVFQDRNGQLWIGTNGSGLLRLGTQSKSSVTTADGLSSNVVLSLAEDSKGRLLVGTPDGLNILEGQTIHILTSADGLPDDFIRSIFTDADGSLWLGTRRGLAHISDGVHTNLTAADGLPSELVGSILRGRDGCLWIGTLKGLARLKDGKITTRLSEVSLPGAAITTLFEDSDGTLWIGTPEQGLIRIALGHAFQFPASVGLPQTILGIVEDSRHHLWITSANGLFRVDRQELNAFARDKNHIVSVVVYGTADGLPVNAFSEGGHPTVVKAADGTLWFASTKGLVALDEAHSAPNPMLPPVVLESVSIDDRSVPPEKAVDLAPGLFRIAFAYAGLSFITPQKIRYKYRLEGFDREWVDAGTRRVAYYTNLAPGKYRFAVLARNSDGVWNNSGAVFSFRLRPHFYQTVWFYVLLAMLASSFIYAVYRWRVRQVQAQFDAVLAERTRIAREIHDTLAQGFVAVSVQLELVNRVLPTSIESAAQLLLQTRTLVQESLAEARRSIWDLRSAQAAEHNLPARLSQSIRNAIKNTQLELNFQTVGAYRPLPPKTEDELLRIAQEAVANVVRHAHATLLAITLSYDSEKALMQVSDNGRGFSVRPDLQGPEGHYGLRGMRERAESIGASLAIVSSREAGTQLSLEVHF